MRKILAIVTVFVGSGLAKASPIFSFSITNTIGNVPGTATGLIYGLPDNGTGSATSVLITTVPAGLVNLTTLPVDAKLWDQQYQNSFTVVNDQVVSGGFWAQQTIGGTSVGYQLYINGDGGPFNFVNLDGSDTSYVWGTNGFAAANIRLVTPVAAIPEPATVAVFGGIALAGAFGYRRRTAAA